MNGIANNHRSIIDEGSQRPPLRETKAGCHRTGKVRALSPVPADVSRLIRTCKSNNDTAKIRQIIDQLCSEFAFGPSRQNASALGGLIGLAAVAIALSQVLSHNSYVNYLGRRRIFECYHPASPGLLFRPGFSPTILCFGVDVQHCQSCEGRDPVVLQPSFRCVMQGCHHFDSLSVAFS